MRGVRQCQGEHADVSVRPPRCVPQVLRQDHPGGRVPEGATPAMRHLPHQDRAPKTLVARTGHACHAWGQGPPRALRGPRGDIGTFPPTSRPGETGRTTAGQPLPAQCTGVSFPQASRRYVRGRGTVSFIVVRGVLLEKSVGKIPALLARAQPGTSDADPGASTSSPCVVTRRRQWRPGAVRAPHHPSAGAPAAEVTARCPQVTAES